MNQFKVGDLVWVDNPFRSDHGRFGLVESVSPSGGRVGVRFDGADDWAFFWRRSLKLATVYVPLSEAVSAVEVQRAYERDCTPATNGDAWEAQMLTLLATQDRRERVTTAVTGLRRRYLERGV